MLGTTVLYDDYKTTRRSKIDKEGKTNAEERENGDERGTKSAYSIYSPVEEKKTIIKKRTISHYGQE